MNGPSADVGKVFLLLDADGRSELTLGLPQAWVQSVPDSGALEVWAFHLDQPVLRSTQLMAGLPAEFKAYGAQEATVGFGLSLTGAVRAAWLGRTVWLQAVDYRPGDVRVSNPLVQPVG